MPLNFILLFNPYYDKSYRIHILKLQFNLILVEIFLYLTKHNDRRIILDYESIEFSSFIHESNKALFTRHSLTPLVLVTVSFH